jgi:hypothetical protein
LEPGDISVPTKELSWDLEIGRDLDMVSNFLKNVYRSIAK